MKALTIVLFCIAFLLVVSSLGFIVTTHYLNFQKDSGEESGIVGMANPASTYCVKNGGVLEIRKDSEGNEYGICKFSNGIECEEWAYYRGACSATLTSIEAKAKEFCSDEGVDSVYTCGEYIKVVSSLLGGGSTYYKYDSELSSGIQCPVVSPNSMSEECKQLTLGSNCVEKKIC